MPVRFDEIAWLDSLQPAPNQEAALLALRLARHAFSAMRCDHRAHLSLCEHNWWATITSCVVDSMLQSVLRSSIHGMIVPSIRHRFK